MRRFLAAPLLHFLVLGSALFLGARAWGRDDDARVIGVSRATREHLRVELEAELGRAATAEEKAAALERWKGDEVVVREARRLGMERDDGDKELWALLGARAKEVYWGLEIPRAPTEAELGAYLAENRALYELPERFEFEQAFAAREKGDAESRARGFVTRAAQGEALSSQGDEFEVETDGAQPFEEIARAFGFGFATGLVKANVGEMVVLEGTRGFHAVRLKRRLAPELPAIDELRPRLVRDWQRGARAEASSRAMKRLLERYRFVEQGP